jgi:SpoIID/LytB domain protein
VKHLVRLGVAVVVVAALLPALGARQAHAYPTPTVEFEGHGFGHGLGMGAWGAHGTAVRNPNKPGEEIALHYFPGARLVPWTNEPIRAWLDYDTPFVDTIVTAGDPATYPEPPTRYTSPFTVVDLYTGRDLGRAGPAPGGSPYWRVVQRGNALTVQTAPDAGGGPHQWEGPGQTVAEAVVGPVEFRPYPGPENPGWRGFLQVQTAGTWRLFRGTVQAVREGAEVRTIVVSPVQQYLYGVLAVEAAEDRWGPSVDKPVAGKEGLRALAVVARTYALNKRQAALASARSHDLCSTSNCQNFRGWGYVGPGGGVVQVEDDRLNAAVDTTTSGGAPTVLVYGNPPQPILAAYASSSGGWTKQGEHPYLAPVRDPDDDIEANPSHTWRISVPVERLEAGWPEIGTLSSIQVQERNGLGDMGGRVVRAVVAGSKGQVVVTGNDLRGKLGLKSDWFRILAPGGYWIAGGDGGVFSFGNAGYFGSAGGLRLSSPIVGMAATASRNGYWLVAADGGIFNYGDAGFHGSTGNIRLARPVVGMAAAPGGGYWTVASDGGIFSFGAPFHGSTGNLRLNKPVVGMAPTPTGNGYWLVASDGGIFAFGDARFHGSTGTIRLAQPVVAMAPTPTGDGYWLVAADGGIFAFGDARFMGSTGGMRVNQPVTGMAPTPTGDGYWLVAADGGIFAFGDADFWGSVPLAAPASRTTKVAIQTSRIGF